MLPPAPLHHQPGICGCSSPMPAPHREKLVSSKSSLGSCISVFSLSRAFPFTFHIHTHTHLENTKRQQHNICMTLIHSTSIPTTEVTLLFLNSSILDITLTLQHDKCSSALQPGCRHYLCHPNALQQVCGTGHSQGSTAVPCREHVDMECQAHTDPLPSDLQSNQNRRKN